MDQPDLVEEALAAGATDYLVKGDRNRSALCRSIRDVIFRQASERLHSEERQLLRSVIETIPDRIYVKDIEGRYIIDNAAHRRFIGVHTLEEVIGKTAYDFFPLALAAQFAADDNAIIRSGQPMLEREEARVDEHGQPAWMITSKVPLHDASGKAIGVLGVSRNITTRKLAEAERDQSNSALRQALSDLQVSHEELKATQLLLIQTEKLESLGRLAAGVAHEVKNPLAQIMLAADFLTSSLPAEDAVLQTVLGDIRHAVMLDFSAPNELRLRAQNINATVRQSVRLLKSELITGHVEISFSLGEGLPEIALDENKIEQVFVNLCTNAIHAMPKGGVLSIKTCMRELAEGDERAGARTSEGLRAGDSVVVAEFSDNGHGIPAGKGAAIFDPFFTTKPPGKGTGLGLTVSRKIVELHGGRLEVENRPEGGVRASVIFPIKNLEQAPAAPAPPL
jgi:PAS domain S-box-containing protein